MSSPTLNDLGHNFIDAFSGTDSTPVREEANTQTNVFKIVGIVSMVASAVLAIVTLSYSLWLIAGLSLIPFLIGREIYVVGSNANELIDHAFLRGLTSLMGVTLSRSEFDSFATKDTCLMNCLVQHMECLTSDLYQRYLDVKNPPMIFE